jgi:hypothetical protein
MEGGFVSHSMYYFGTKIGTCRVEWFSQLWIERNQLQDFTDAVSVTGNEVIDHFETYPVVF